MEEHCRICRRLIGELGAYLAWENSVKIGQPFFYSDMGAESGAYVVLVAFPDSGGEADLCIGHQYHNYCVDVCLVEAFGDMAIGSCARKPYEIFSVHYTNLYKNRWAVTDKRVRERLGMDVVR